MSEPSYCAGIDVGTTKVCTVVGRKTDPGELDIVGVGTAPSAGLKSGIVVDREDAINAIRASVEQAREMSRLPIRSAYVGITGDHVRSTNVVGRVHTGPRGEITAEDVEQARQSAIDSVPCPVDREIVHTVVRDYSVDGASGVSRPVGMSGRRLDVLLHVVTGMSTTIANVRSCVEAVGVEARVQVLEPIATGRAVLTDAERDLGVLLVDIGGGTSDVAVFVDNSICHTGAVPVAGDRITRDIAEVLRISNSDAEELKRRHGVALPELVSENDMVSITKADGLEVDRTPRRLVAEIMEARLSEIFDLIKSQLARAPVPKVGGIVLSGGGCLAPGTAKLAGRIFDDIPARTSKPTRVVGLTNLVDSPIFATGVGLAAIATDEDAFAAVSRPATIDNQDVRSWIAQTWTRMRKLLPW